MAVRELRGWILGGVLLVGAVVIALSFPDEGALPPPSADAGNAGETDPAPSTATDALPEGVLAGPSSTLRLLDRAVGPSFSLGFVAEEDGVRCEIEASPPDFPFGHATCGDAPVSELAVSTRRHSREPTEIGTRTYHVDDEGSLVIVDASGTRTVADMPAESETMDVCDLEAGSVVAVSGHVVHGVRQTAVVFVDDGADPIAATVETQVFDAHLSCRAEDARLTWLAADGGDDPALVVHQAICEREGCRRLSSRVPATGTDPISVGLGGKVLLVDVVDGATRMRSAPIDALPLATALEVPDEAAGPVLSRRLFAWGSAALVVLRTPSGHVALRVDQSGDVTRLPVSR